jgi:hypothetical protein
MAAVTPTVTNLSLGSVSGKLAYFNSVNSGDYWASSITDIVAIFGSIVGAGSTASTTSISTSWTATSGMIYLYPASQAKIVNLLVMAGTKY